MTSSPPARTVADSTPRPRLLDEASFSAVAGSSKTRSRDCTGDTPGGKVGDVGSVREPPGGEQRHPDASVVGDADEPVVEVDAARRVEVGEHLSGPTSWSASTSGSTRRSPPRAPRSCRRTPRRFAGPPACPTGSRFCTFHVITVSSAIRSSREGPEQEPSVPDAAVRPWLDPRPLIGRSRSRTRSPMSLRPGAKSASGGNRRGTR